MKAPASAWPLSTALFNATAAASGPKGRWAKGRPFTLPCPNMWKRAHRIAGSRLKNRLGIIRGSRPLPRISPWGLLALGSFLIVHRVAVPHFFSPGGAPASALEPPSFSCPPPPFFPCFGSARGAIDLIAPVALFGGVGLGACSFFGSALWARSSGSDAAAVAQPVPEGLIVEPPPKISTEPP